MNFKMTENTITLYFYLIIFKLLSLLCDLLGIIHMQIMPYNIFLRSESAQLLAVLAMFFTLSQGYGEEWEKVDEKKFWTDWSDIWHDDSEAKAHPRYPEWMKHFAKYQEEINLLIQRLGVLRENVFYYMGTDHPHNTAGGFDHFYLNFPTGLHDQKIPVAVKSFCEKEVIASFYDVVKREDGAKGKDSTRTRSLPNGFCIREYVPKEFGPTDTTPRGSRGQEVTAKGLWNVCRDDICIPLDNFADILGYGPMRINASDAGVLFEKGYGPIFFVFIPIPGHSPKVALLRYRFFTL
jgi:hypothetical protein